MREYWVTFWQDEDGFLIAREHPQRRRIIRDRSRWRPLYRVHVRLK